MPVDALLSRLDGVRKRGHEARWMAKCPAHADRSASLSIREEADGRTLIHCFAGCATADVISVVGMTFEDLFPPRPLDPAKPAKAIKRPWRVQDMIAALDFELHVIWVLLAEIEIGRPMDVDRRRRAGEAKRRACRFIEELSNVH